MKLIEEKIGSLIVQLCRAHRQEVDSRLNELGLRAGQEMILLQLWDEEGITQSQLAERCRVEPPTITKMLHHLESFVARSPDPDDARISRVYLTERGHALQKPVLEIWDNMHDLTLTGLTLTEQALLRRMLIQIVANLGASGC